MKKIIVIEDEKPISQVLKAYLVKEKFTVVQCYRGDEAMNVIAKEKPDLILLDVMLPGRSGWDILEEVRTENIAPVIMLTALGNVPDRLKGFNQGADDYISKPFVADEVVARVHAVLRRVYDYQHPVKRFGDLEIDPIGHHVILNGNEIDLTPRDLSVLLFLTEHPNQTFSREQLIEHVWGWDYEGSDRAVDLSIKRIRKALNKWPESQGAIKTIRGLGYQFSV